MTEHSIVQLVGDERVFVCPRTKQPLRAMNLEYVKSALGATELSPRLNTPPLPFGITSSMLVREDDLCAYPIVDGIPILLTPEQITASDRPQQFDLADQRYAEAYEEMTVYNEVASQESLAIKQSESYRSIEPVLRLNEEGRLAFPDPARAWIDVWPSGIAQYEAFRHLLPIRDKRVLQLGGKGIHAVKFLLAGAKEAWLVTPMLGEVLCSITLAREAGVVDRLRCAVGVAEELPLADELFDAVYSGGCVHHMVTQVAFPEILRVLKKGGRFSSVDPWRAPFYGIGIKVLGKRERNVYCRPLTRSRVAPLFSTFPEAMRIQHGTLTRYPAIALEKIGIRIPGNMMWRVSQLDDAICSLIPGMRKLGSSVTLCATK